MTPLITSQSQKKYDCRSKNCLEFCFRGIIGEYRGLCRIPVYPSEFGDHAGWNQIVLDWHAPQSYGLETYLIQTNTILKMISEAPSDSVCVTGEWMWIDNTVVDYTNWKPRMPNDAGYCVEVQSSTGMWSTTNCNIYKPYICKTAKGSLSKQMQLY